MKTKQISKLTQHLSDPAAEIVAQWFDDINHPSITKNIVRQLFRHRRTNHRQVALGYVMSQVARGETLERIISSWVGSGGYLVSFGVGPGFFKSSIKRDEIGVHIRDRGIKVFKLGELYAEAEILFKQRQAGIISLFK